MGRPSSKRSDTEAGFTLVEVLAALLIVATTVAVLQAVSNATARSAVDTNRLRTARMLLRERAEAVALGIETGSGGPIEGYPGYSFEVSEIEAPVAGEETVRQVTVTVRYPSFGTPERGPTGPAVAEGEDEPGSVRVTTLLDPPEATARTASQGGT